MAGMTCRAGRENEHCVWEGGCEELLGRPPLYMYGFVAYLSLNGSLPPILPLPSCAWQLALGCRAALSVAGDLERTALLGNSSSVEPAAPTTNL